MSSFSTTTPSTRKGPAGTGDYSVQQGDCLSSIAYLHGFFWETLWNHGANAGLKAVRRNPNVLLPGDRITIPPLRKKKVPAATGKRHKFQLLNAPAKLRLQFLEDGEPLKDEPYKLDIDGQLRTGTLDDKGRLVESIPPNASFAKICIGESDEWLEVDLGTVDPISEISGVQGRLNDLGFGPGPVDNIMGPKTRAAIARFQHYYELPVTGEPDQTTMDKLVQIHGC